MNSCSAADSAVATASAGAPVSPVGGYEESTTYDRRDRCRRPKQVGSSLGIGDECRAALGALALGLRSLRGILWTRCAGKVRQHATRQDERDPEQCGSQDPRSAVPPVTEKHNGGREGNDPHRHEYMGSRMGPDLGKGRKR